MINMLRYNMGEKEKFLISFVETPPEIIDLMVNLIKKPKSASVLDSGSGKGLFIKGLLKSEFKNIEAIELNEKNYNHLIKSFNEKTIYNEDYLNWDPGKKYDTIIGNPPYQHYNSLPEQIRQEVASIVNSKESDIYYAFIMKSIDLLEKNGELIYIVPYGFFYNTHAKNVRRKIIENGFIEFILDLDEARLFKGENPETIIFKFVKKKEDNSLIKVLKLKDKNLRPKNIYDGAIAAINNKESNEIFEYYIKPQYKDHEIPWSSNKKIDLGKSNKLKDLAFVGVGLVSGYDSAFKLDKDLSYSKNEISLINKFIKGSNCAGFQTNGTSEFFITDGIENENVLKENYPNIYSIFEDYKEDMSKRYLPNNKEWYEWQALRNKKKIDKLIEHPKIFVPTLDRSKENRFSISNENVYPAGDVLIIIPLKVDPYFLMGYLNSAFFRRYYLAHGARRGGRIAYTQRILANIKIPEFNTETVDLISSIVREILETGDKSKRKYIDELILNSLNKKISNNTSEEKGKITAWL